MFSDVGRGLSIVIDGGNGVAGKLYADIVRKTGAKVFELYTEPDGTFPHHAADPSKWETLTDLQATVLKTKANAGFAFDGDGDRLGIVDREAVSGPQTTFCSCLPRSISGRNRAARSSSRSVTPAFLKRRSGNGEGFP